MFPFLAKYALGFAIFTIVLEIIIGVLLILGHRTKFTSWLFLGIMAFFTALTGYTHFTGYVPDGVNFFAFSKWGEYVATNMKVTDCGCFGDFLKLSPTTSFYKDIALMPVAVFFVWHYRRFTQLFKMRIRATLGWLTVAASIVFCFYNAFWNEPIVDFRPFKNGVNIREQKKAEEKARADVKILTWKLKNQKTGELVTLSNDDYMGKKMYEKYSTDAGWKVFDQIKTIPSVSTTKISDFSIETLAGDDFTDSLLTEKNYTFLVVSGKMKSTMSKQIIAIPDSVFRTDTLRKKVGGRDTFTLTKVFERVGKREEVFKSFSFDADYRAAFSQKINPIMEAAEKSGYKIAALVPFDDLKKIEDFRHDAQTAYPFFKADEKLIKTIMRSNPGLVLLHDGQIVHKWHLNKLPNFEEIKTEYLK